jgi:hypothetical protein
MDISRKIDKFYLLMLMTKCGNNGRGYEIFSERYTDIETELKSILAENKIKPLNENRIRIWEIILELWQKYKEEHKTKNTLSSGLIKLNRKTFYDLFNAVKYIYIL